MLDVSDLIGIPYKENGRDKNGFDCYGLTIEVEKRLSKNLNDLILTDRKNPDLEKINLPTLNVKPTNYIKEGTIIEMITPEGALHIGVAINERQFIHTTAAQGVRINSIGVIKIKGFFEIWEK